MIRLTFIVWVGLLSATSSLCFAEDYKLGGKLYIQVYKDENTLGASLAHNHVILAKEWTGTASYDSNQPENCKVTITIPVVSLDVDPDSMRQALNYPTMMNKEQRAKIRTHMLSKDQLYIDVHPVISFQATQCSSDSVTGILTIRGKSQRVSVPAKIKEDGRSFSALGTLIIRASQFGFQPYSSLFGQLKNRDDMKLTIDIVHVP